jgi:hypothetical protein
VRLSQCTASTMDWNLIFSYHLSHTLFLLVKWGRTLIIHGKVFLKCFLYVPYPTCLKVLQWTEIFSLDST